MDGVHGLRKRPVTRLWYRRIPEPVDAHDILDCVLDPSVGTDELFSGLLSDRIEPDNGNATVERRTGSTPSVQVASDDIDRNALPKDAKPTPVLNGLPAGWQDEWRTVPATAPSLLLAGSSLLDTRVPGPVLRPGCRYRVVGMHNGVVGLAVASAEGEVAIGFCAAVDLACSDSRFAARSATRQLGAAAGSLRTKAKRVSWSLTQTTTSLLS
ncbi:MAG: hypothetical protein C4346_11575 [Chloroflexota bacterium]